MESNDDGRWALTVDGEDLVAYSSDVVHLATSATKMVHLLVNLHCWVVGSAIPPIGCQVVPREPVSCPE